MEEVLFPIICRIENIYARQSAVPQKTEVKPHNRKAIEAHELSSYITLIEGRERARLRCHALAEDVAKKKIGGDQRSCISNM